MASVPGEDRATWSPPAPRSWRRLPLLAWDAPLYVHLPAGDPFDPQRLPETGSGHDRWSRPGQPTIYLASDPLGTGANLLGTANTQVNYTLISSTGIWYVQVAALIAGHVAGLVLAHDRALTVFADDKRAAIRSQYWMLTVMVGFTCLGLWLLSAVNA